MAAPEPKGPSQEELALQALDSVDLVISTIQGIAAKFQNEGFTPQQSREIAVTLFLTAIKSQQIKDKP